MRIKYGELKQILREVGEELGGYLGAPAPAPDAPKKRKRRPGGWAKRAHGWHDKGTARR